MPKPRQPDCTESKPEHSSCYLGSQDISDKLKHELQTALGEYRQSRNSIQLVAVLRQLAYACIAKAASHLQKKSLNGLQQLMFRSDCYLKGLMFLHAACKLLTQTGVVEKEIEKVENEYCREVLEMDFNHRRVNADFFTCGHISLISKLNQIRDMAKQRLEGLRRDSSEFVTKVKQLYADIAKAINDLLYELLGLCGKILKKPSSGVVLEYAILWLGSLARKEMTPYSDVEFAILIEDNTDDIKKYFYTLSVLFAFKMLHFRETAIPRDLLRFSEGTRQSEVIDLDDIIQPGFQLDLGGKTPLGRPTQDYSLIQTPERMAEYIRQPLSLPNGARNLLPIELVTYVEAGSVTSQHYLVTRYAMAIDQNLPKLMENFTQLVRQDMIKFDPHIYTSVDEGKFYKVKDDLYRLINAIVDDLAWRFQLVSRNTLARIEEMITKRKFPSAIASSLQDAFAQAMYMRLQVYQQAGQQREICDIGYGRRVDRYFSFTIEELVAVYKVLLPFHEAMQGFMQEYPRMENLQDFKVIADDFTLGLIYLRFCCHVDARACFTQWLNDDTHQVRGEDVSVSSILKRMQACIHLGATIIQLGEDGAIKYLGESMALLQQLGERVASDQLVRARAQVEELLAMTSCGTAKEARKRIEMLEKVLPSKVGEDRASTLLNLGCAYIEIRGRNETAKEKLREAEECATKTIRDQRKKELILARIWVELAMCSDNEEEKREYLRKAWTNERKYYGDDHPEIIKTAAHLLCCAGIDENTIREARVILERALGRSVVNGGPDGVEAGRLYHIIGLDFQRHGQLVNAESFFRKALQIKLENSFCYGDGSTYLAENRERLAQVLLSSDKGTNLDKYCEAMRFLKEAITAYKNLERSKKLECCERIAKFVADKTSYLYEQVRKKKEDLNEASIGKIKEALLHVIEIFTVAEARDALDVAQRKFYQFCHFVEGKDMPGDLFEVFIPYTVFSLRQPSRAAASATAEQQPSASAPAPSPSAS